MSVYYLLVLLAVASNAAFTTMLLEGVRDDWQQLDSDMATQQHTLLWAVKQSASDEVLTEKLLAVSDPRSPTYGQHLSFKEIGDLVANPVGTKAVQDYLESIGASVIKVTPHGEYIRASAPVAVWNTALTADFRVFVERDTGRQMVRTTRYAVPSALRSHVAFVGYTVDLPPVSAPKINTPKDVGTSAVVPGSGSVTPALLESFYGITGQGNSKSTQGPFAGIGQDYSPKDLAAFQTMFGLPAETIVRDVGGHDLDEPCVEDPNNCGEANLDVQYIMAVAPGAPTTFWYIANETSPFVAFLEAVAGDPDAPLVQSISYGGPERMIDTRILDAFNTEAQKAGLRGMTIVVASGDDGANSNQARGRPEECGLSPSFPASCPWVLSVGATQGPEFNQVEVAESSDLGGLITSGGGFSTYWPQPAYQYGAVNGWLQTVVPYPPFPFPYKGRAYPDISMIGHNYDVVNGGMVSQVSGTSASCPVVAAMITLANARRFEKGSTPLGFVNLMLYQNPSVANDITFGKNTCCAGEIGGATCCPFGYYAFKGWDPVTGMGSLDYQRFAKVAMNDTLKF